MVQDARDLRMTRSIFDAGREILVAYLRLAKRAWLYLPPSVLSSQPGKSFARHLNFLIRLIVERRQYFATFFLRNRYELETLRSIVEQMPHGSRIDIAVLACSKGAEVYSIAWMVRSARADLDLHLHAVDISRK